MNLKYGASVGSIIHPTDFSHGSEVAFAHALKLTLGAKGQHGRVTVTMAMGAAALCQANFEQPMGVVAIETDHRKRLAFEFCDGVGEVLDEADR